MSEDYQRITKILVWIVSLSMVAYFVISPFSYTRPNPPRISPGNETIIPTTTEQGVSQQQTDIPENIPENLLPNQETKNFSENLNNSTQSPAENIPNQ